MDGFVSIVPKSIFFSASFWFYRFHIPRFKKHFEILLHGDRTSFLFLAFKIKSLGFNLLLLSWSFSEVSIPPLSYFIVIRIASIDNLKKLWHAKHFLQKNVSLLLFEPLDGSNNFSFLKKKLFPLDNHNNMIIDIQFLFLRSKIAF